jgi:hypothetical protein
VTTARTTLLFCSAVSAPVFFQQKLGGYSKRTSLAARPPRGRRSRVMQFRGWGA